MQDIKKLLLIFGSIISILIIITIVFIIDITNEQVATFTDDNQAKIGLSTNNQIEANSNPIEVSKVNEKSNPFIKTLKEFGFTEEIVDGESTYYLKTNDRLEFRYSTYPDKLNITYHNQSYMIYYTEMPAPLRQPQYHANNQFSNLSVEFKEKLESSEVFQTYLKHIGVGMAELNKLNKN